MRAQAADQVVDSRLQAGPGQHLDVLVETEEPAGPVACLKT